MRSRGSRVLGAVVLLALSTLACSATALSDGQRHGQWQVVFTGGGDVMARGEQVVLEPAPATSHETTHAGLVTTSHRHEPGTDFAITVTTEQQIRHGTPNPWEVGWVLWNYSDTDHFYALALKPNGWEITKQDPAYRGGQRFLHTGSKPAFPLGRDYRVEVEQRPSATIVTVDGEPLARFQDTEEPYRDGAIGFYTEDARVRFSDLVTTPPSPETQ